MPSYFFAGDQNQKSTEELENRAVAAERRVAHISSLLSEAESENSRLSELTSVLKEEIRSVQRSEERSKHIENLEYVKNIIVKVLDFLDALKDSEKRAHSTSSLERRVCV